MITRFRAENFQAHELIDFRLGERVTTIVGPSDAGKSAVVRAVRWLAMARPLGDAHVRDGAAGCEVRLRVDGRTVARERRGREAKYRIGSVDYRASGTEVPGPVADVLNLGPVNFQNQHEGPYWLSLTPGEVAKELNAVVALDAIDAILGALAGRLRSARSEREAAARRVAESREEVEALEWTTEADAALRRIEGLAIERKETESIEQRLRSLVADLERAERAAAVELPDTSRMDELAIIIKETTSNVLELERLTRSAKETDIRACQLDNQLAAAERELDKMMVGTCPVCGKEM